MKSADIKPGARVGTLVAIAKTVRTLSSGRRMPAWSLKCDCGKIIVAMTVNITKGKHQSCGCKKGELTCKARGFKGDTKRPEYGVYRQMLDRCYLTTAPNYQYYGAKGVTVCDRWRKGTNSLTGFQAFLEDMGERPAGLTLERSNPFNPYSPDNCRWATWQEQAANKREHHLSPLERTALRKRRADAYRKVTPAMRSAIVRRLRAGDYQWPIARAFGISQTTVSKIKSEAF